MSSDGKTQILEWLMCRSCTERWLWLQLLSPRFKGPVAGALAGHPFLTLKHWDPWMPIKQLVQHIRSFLQVRYCPSLPLSLPKCN